MSANYVRSMKPTLQPVVNKCPSLKRMSFSRIFVPHALLSLRSVQLLVGKQSDAQTLCVLAAIPMENVITKTFTAASSLQIGGIFEPELMSSDNDIADDIRREMEQRFGVSTSNRQQSSLGLFVHLGLTAGDQRRIVVKSLLQFEHDPRSRPPTWHSGKVGSVSDIFLFDPKDFSSRTLEILMHDIDPVEFENPAVVDRRAADRLVDHHQKVKCPEILYQILRAKASIEKHASTLPLTAVNFFEDTDGRCAFLAIVCCSAIAFFAGATQKIFRMSGLMAVSSIASPYVNLANQTQNRFRQVAYLNSEFTNKNSILHWNAVCTILLDIILGITVTWALGRFSSVETLFDMFLQSAEIVVEQLQDMLKWMMGSPAGFKLNFPLNYSLGTFFLFHIYLWQEYLGLIKPALSTILQAALYTGIFGLSFQLSLLQDLVALSTFHVYCFYAYAAKLYGLHVAGLAAFWRLFRGKKWNPLRQRVDSCSYDTDQLFIGTLSLTILLFLMPTITLYYVVFTMLRLSVLSAQVVLYKMTSFINSVPIYMLALYVIRSKQLISDVTVSVVSSKSMGGGVLVVRIQGTISSWKRATSVFTDRVETNECLTWSDFIKSLITV